MNLHTFICNWNKFYIRKTIRSLKIQCNQRVSEIKCNKSSPKFCLESLRKRNNCSAAISPAATTFVIMSMCIRSTAVAEHEHLSWKTDFLPDFRDIAVDAFTLFNLWYFNFNYYYSVPFGEIADICVLLLFSCIIFALPHVNRERFISCAYFSTHAVRICSAQ